LRALQHTHWGYSKLQKGKTTLILSFFLFVCFFLSHFLRLQDSETANGSSPSPPAEAPPPKPPYFTSLRPQTSFCLGIDPAAGRKSPAENPQPSLAVATSLSWESNISN
jgi:hypothetical protein